MTVYRQSHRQQMRTWGHATATLRRNCACGVGKDRMRAGRATYPRQEKPICAQVNLISESLQVNRNNERKLCAKRKLKQGGYLCSRLTMRPTSRPTLNAFKCMNFKKTSHRPTSGSFHLFTNRASVQALRLYACVHNHIFTISIQGRTVGHKVKETTNQEQTNSLTTAGTLAIFPRAGVKARGILLVIAVYDWLINDKNNNKNSYLKASNP